MRVHSRTRAGWTCALAGAAVLGALAADARPHETAQGSDRLRVLVVHGPNTAALRALVEIVREERAARR